MSFITNRVRTWFNSLPEDKKDNVTTPYAKSDVAYVNSSDAKKGYGSEPETFSPMSMLISERVSNIDSARDRNIMAYYHPWQHANIFKVSEHLCMEIPQFLKPGTENEEEPEIREDIIDGWNEFRLQEAWKKFIEKSRIHGYGLVDPIKPSELFDGYSGPPWYVRSADECKPMEWKLGHPIKWDIHPSNKKINPYSRTIKEVIFNDPSNSDDFDGIPEGIDIWDELLDYIMIWEAVKSFDQRLGNGFMIIGVPMTTLDTEIDAIEDDLRHVRTQMGLVVKMNVEEPVSVDWQQMAGAQVDFISHLNKLEDIFALSMGFPKRWMLGDAEGAMESSGKDAMQINIKLKAIFARYIPFIKSLLLYYKLISDPTEIVIRPAFEMQLSEEEKLVLADLKTTTISKKSWLTNNEKRNLDGYEDLSPEQEEELNGMNQFGIDIGGGQQPDKEEPPEKDNDKEMEEKTDTFDILSDIFTTNGISIRDLSKLTGVSPTTISKIRSNMIESNKPNLKIENLSFKTDSVMLDDTNFIIEDVPLVLPQEKQYGKRLCVRSREEIKKAFDDPATPREYRIGVTVNDDHSSKVQLEVLKENAVGRVKLTRIDEEGRIRGNIEGNLANTERLLGSDNWLKDSIATGKNPNTSIALWTKDKPMSDNRFYESDLDIRSFVFTRSPRNKEAGL